MFTGIVQAIGHIAAREPQGEDLRLRLHCGELPLADVQLGDSIAVNGVCLTVVELPGDGFWADVSRESLDKTTLNQLPVNSRVNLEKAMTPTTRLGGHLVSGHIDGVGDVVGRQPVGRAVEFTLQAPADLSKYIASKGSICVDGISLTVNAVRGNLFDLMIVPHTLQATTLASCRPGQQVNLEVDIIARYLERLLLGDRAATPESAGLTREFLAQHGFIK
ncbi:MAG: riboflavin synthase [Gammaproteobacteria bacterium]|nr:riboflavin synthase [Gammaproteobacteria bacterium]